MARLVNGAAIREMRKLAGITQRDLARRAGVSAVRLCQVEAGAQASPSVVRKLADELGVPLDAITYTVPEAEAAS